MVTVGVYKADGLRAVRDRRGMQITVLCERANVARGTVYAAERGSRVQLALLIRMARVLEVPLADISSEAARELEDAGFSAAPAGSPA